MKKTISPLYFVPIVRPQKVADSNNIFKEKPFSIHLSNNKSDAVEKNISHKST